jgi:DNA polymerase-3 subunit epsilon
MHWFRRRPENLPDVVQHYLDAPRPDTVTPWRRLRFAVIDVETTGLDARRDALLAVGLHEIIDARIILEQHWYSLVRPPADAPVRPEAIQAHGLLFADVADARPETEVLPDLLHRLSGRILIVHVADVDIAFLNRALKRVYGIELRGPAIDTARLALSLHQHRQLMSGGVDRAQPEIALRSLARQAGLPDYAEHHALNDALTTAQLFLVQATRLEQQGAGTLAALLRAGGCLK